MGSPHWPPFGVEVRTPRLTLRGLDDELADELIARAGRGIHDPATMPFAIPWTDQPSPARERDSLRFYWSARARCRPESWSLEHAVIVDGVAVGACGIRADDFGHLGEVTTGSWLGLEYQGRGLGREMRMAALALGFDGLGAEWALSDVWHDNRPSRGVTRSLGYQERGRRRMLRRGVPDEIIDYAMPRAHWATIRRDDITLHGVDALRDFLAITR